jgi:hypothetical protein
MEQLTQQIIHAFIHFFFAHWFSVFAFGIGVVVGRMGRRKRI